MQSPRLRPAENHLWGITALNSHDTWAVVESFNGRSRTALIEHWDGIRWNVAATQKQEVSPSLQDVASLSDKDV